MSHGFLSNGDKGARTPDLLDAIETLSQLSYTPVDLKAYPSHPSESRQPTFASKPALGRPSGARASSSKMRTKLLTLSKGLPMPSLYQWFQILMAVITVIPFLGLFFKPWAHSYRYATFMSSWSASTLFWVFWLLGDISTLQYFLSLAITCFFPVLWFYRTKMR